MTTVQIESNRQETFDAVGGLAARYGLAIVIGAFGLLKFTNYEAQGIAPLVAESPFMSWLYDIFSVYTFSVLLGVFEVAAAVLIAVKPWWPKASILGSALAILLFVATISFLFTTPGAFDDSVRLSRTLADHRFSVQGRGLAWHFAVDAGRRAAGNPQQSRRFLTGSRNLAMPHWRV